MQPQAPITKTEFIEAFKTCNKYLESNYIAQETFFENMARAMVLAKQYQQDKLASTLDFFDEVSYRIQVVSVAKMMGPEYWRDYGNLSEQMRAEANRFFFAAGTDAASIAVGAGVGKLASKVTKAISRPNAKHLVKAVTKNKHKVDVNVNRLAGSKSIPTQMTASVSLNTHKSILGLEMLPWKEPTLKNTVIEATFSPTEVFFGELSDGITDYAEQTLVPNLVSDDTISFSFGDSLVAEAGNVVTDFIPYVGNAKAGVSAFFNYLVGREYSKTAKRIEKIEKQDMEADRKFFNAYLFVDIEKDLNAMDKDKLYQMWQFALNYFNR